MVFSFAPTASSLAMLSSSVVPLSSRVLSTTSTAALPSAMAATTLGAVVCSAVAPGSRVVVVSVSFSVASTVVSIPSTGPETGRGGSCDASNRGASGTLASSVLYGTSPEAPLLSSPLLLSFVVSTLPMPMLVLLSFTFTFAFEFMLPLPLPSSVSSWSLLSLRRLLCLCLRRSSLRSSLYLRSGRDMSLMTWHALWMALSSESSSHIPSMSLGDCCCCCKRSSPCPWSCVCGATVGSSTACRGSFCCGGATEAKSPAGVCEEDPPGSVPSSVAVVVSGGSVVVASPSSLIVLDSPSFALSSFCCCCCCCCKFDSSFRWCWIDSLFRCCCCAAAAAE
mmetsp:Transcript_240/g.492  ORF Transcript_240/g.492 Transcript_240/m.492 type:complete len:337 (-) Transcript_240:19-1029(-)